MSYPAIKAVVFDLDGLMFNTEDVFELSGSEVIGRRGHTMTPELRNSMMGRRAEEAFEILIASLQLSESPAELQAETEEIFHNLLDGHLAPMPGLFELLTHIEEAKLPKGVATSSGRAYLEKILTRFELMPRFEVLLTAEDVSQGKPKPEIYLKAAERLNVQPAEMLVLEDSEAGTRAAAAAGAVIVSIPHRHSASQNFDTASHIAESLLDPFILNCLRH